MRSITLSILLIFSTFVIAHASDTPTSKVIQISIEEYPPFTTIKLKHYGLMSHIVTEAFLLEGIKVEYKLFPAARSFLLAERGIVHGTLPWAKRTGREVHFFYSDPILDVGRESFFFKKDSKFKWDPKVRDYNTLKGLHVGMITSYDYGDEFHKAEKDKVFHTYRVTTLKQLFRMLFSGRIDILISKKLVAEYTLQTEFSHEQVAQLNSIPEMIGSPDYDYLLFSKKKPTVQYYLKALNSGLKKLRASGQYDQFIENYYKGKYLNSPE